MSPLEFIPVAEETGLILPIGMHVLNEACKQPASWLDDGLELNVSLNISGRQFLNIDFVEVVRTAVR